MDLPWYASVFPLVHIDIRNRCPQCKAMVYRWAREMGIDPDLIVWESRGLEETPVRVAVDRCDQLRIRSE